MPQTTRHNTSSYESRDLPPRMGVTFIRGKPYISAQLRNSVTGKFHYRRLSLRTNSAQDAYSELSAWLGGIETKILGKKSRRPAKVPASIAELSELAVSGYEFS